jgi:plasmid stabilization system protein ParE
VSGAVTVLPEARQDLLEAREFLDQIRLGLGATFAVEAFKVFDRIAEMPQLYGEVWPGIRAAGVRRFGYVVYCRVVADGVEVIALLHGGRDPHVWQGRA